MSLKVYSLEIPRIVFTELSIDQKNVLDYVVKGRPVDGLLHKHFFIDVYNKQCIENELGPNERNLEGDGTVAQRIGTVVTLICPTPDKKYNFRYWVKTINVDEAKQLAEKEWNDDYSSIGGLRDQINKRNSEIDWHNSKIRELYANYTQQV